MTSYTLDTSSPSPLYPWLKVFMSLSIRWFDKLQDTLSFPSTVNNDLQNIALSFAFTHTLILNKPAWERQKSIAGTKFGIEFNDVGFNILVDPNSEISFEKKMEMLFDKTFSLLENLECADEIYLWGKDTHTYFKLTDREKFLLLNPIKAWRNLIVAWSISKYRQGENKPKELNSLWQIINSRIDWNPVNEAKFEHLPLSDYTKAKLIKISLINESEKLQNLTALDEVAQSASSIWEDYVLRVNALAPWFENEVRYRLNVKMVNLVIDALSADELKKLEEWGIQYKGLYPDLVSPIPRL